MRPVILQLSNDEVTKFDPQWTIFVIIIDQLIFF